MGFRIALFSGLVAGVLLGLGGPAFAQDLTIDLGDDGSLATRAVQGERPRDLRRLNLRYGDYAMSTFYTTVQEGRPPKGMPPWKGILEDDVVWKIYTFLQSVQVED